MPKFVLDLTAEEADELQKTIDSAIEGWEDDLRDAVSERDIERYREILDKLDAADRQMMGQLRATRGSIYEERGRGRGRR